MSSSGMKRPPDNDQRSDAGKLSKVEKEEVIESTFPNISNPAKVYPFKLDPFQSEAISYIDNNESVLVAAHTSAGKTAVAEYAIAKSLRDGQRVIYTSPIKALSNQKYRDLQEEFKDVGLMTGDMTLNPTAACLIMTTEILRSMLYKGSEVMREVAWVIYDEVHYMRDKERGVVWEESIILLPHKVRFVFLSATIPNAKEFVGWVSKLHKQPCHVVYTDYRPTPLQHFIFPSAAEGLFLVVDEKGKFREDNFQKAMSALQSSPEVEDKTQRRKSKKNTSTLLGDLMKIVKLIMERDLDPVIVFSFSKKDCEQYGLQMAKYDFNSDEEKELVEKVFMSALDSLSEDDQTLPQIGSLLPLLKRGIGIHHGGLLPILKEVIEILFQEGLIKCLFATETFSIGINMPAKTVVFTQTRKFDGQDFRWITPGEYIQMSGRAGRRGKDLRGTVIQMIDEKMDPVVAKNMIYGSSDPLSSSYRVGYNMVLNMLRVEDSDPENLLRCSFHQYQQEQLAPELERQAGELQVEADEIIITGADEKVVSDYYLYNRQLVNTRQEMYQEIMKPSHSLPFLASGRLVRVQAYGVDWGWGMVVNYRKAGGSSLTGFSLGFDGDRIDADTFIVDILLNVSKRSANTSDEGDSTTESQQEYEPVSYDSQKGQLEVIRVALRAIVEIAQVRMTIPKDLTKSSTKKNIQNSIREVLRRFATKGGIPELNPIEDIGITHEGFRELFSKYLDLNKNLTESKLNENSKKDEILKIYSSKMDLLERAEVLRAKAQESQAVAMREDLTKMKNVLRQLDFISKDGVLGMKGRFSCELSIADEIVLTEMIFDGSFNDLTPQQAAALMSCFVHKEGSQQTSSVIPVMDAAHKTLQQIVRKVAKVSIENQLISDEEEYVKSFNPDMIEVAYHWSSGSKFSEICKLTDIFEGSIIRVLRRLEELLRQMSSAAFAIGNFELKVKFEQAAISLRRGVVFAASLYI